MDGISNTTAASAAQRQYVRMVFSDNLQYYTRGMTRTEMSDMFGVPLAYVGNYLKGQCLPGVYTLMTIAYQLGITVDDLLYERKIG